MFRLAEKFDKLIKENKRITINGLGYGERAFLLSTIKEKSLLVCLDIDELNKQIFERLTDAIGLTPEEVELYKNKLNFDEKYMFLLLRTQQSADFMWVKDLLDDKTKLNTAVTASNAIKHDKITIFFWE